MQHCEAIGLDTLVDEIRFNLSESSIEDILYLDRLGFTLLIIGGVIQADGTKQSLARLIKDELESGALTEANGFEAFDFARFRLWSDSLYVSQIVEAIDASSLLHTHFHTFRDIINYIISTWTLDKFEKAELAKQDADDRIEFNERSYQ